MASGVYEDRDWREKPVEGVLFCELQGQKIRRFWEYWHSRGEGPSFGAKHIVLGKASRKKSRV